MGLVRIIKSTRTRWLLLIKLFLVFLMIIFISYNLRSRIVYDSVFQGNLTIANEATVSFRAETKANSKNIGINPNISGYIFHNHRLRLWYEGRCIDSSDGEKLTVQFCDPDLQQTFSLTMDNRLIYERTGRCVNYKSQDSSIFLELVDCSDVTESFISEDNDGMFYIQSIVKNEELCITPMSERNDLNVTTSPCLEDPVELTRCHKDASRILLMEESFFQEDRKLLKKAVVPQNSSCDFKACGFNKREPVKLLPLDQVRRCTKLWECVTLAVKTTRRPHLILRLAESVRDSLGFDLPIVAYDDGPNDYPDEIYQQIAEYPLLQYVVSKNEDLGIARGRNLAVMQVKTKYFFLLDDYIKFNEYTKLDKLVEILDTTDVTVASAAYGFVSFTAYFQLGHFNKNKAKRRLGIYHNACILVNQTIPNHPSCVTCDITSNVFLARTKEILDIGGWDPELMIVEHKDIFIRLKAAGMKVALCPDVKVKHARPAKISVIGEDYKKKRKRGGQRFKALMNNRWNIQNIFDRTASNNLMINNDTGEIAYKEEKYEYGSC